MVSSKRVNRSVEIESVPSAIYSLCEQIKAELDNHNFNKEDKFAVHLAMEEAFLNALKHGNKMSSDKIVRIDYLVNPEKVEISVKDEGEGFDPDSIPDPRCGPNLFRTSGRGLFLMRSYMDVVEYNKKGNCVHMVRYKEKPPVKGSRKRD